MDSGTAGGRSDEDDLDLLTQTEARNRLLRALEAVEARLAEARTANRRDELDQLEERRSALLAAADRASKGAERWSAYLRRA